MTHTQVLGLALAALVVSSAAMAAPAITPLGAAIAEQGNRALRQIREDAAAGLRERRPDPVATLQGDSGKKLAAEETQDLSLAG